MDITNSNKKDSSPKNFLRTAAIGVTFIVGLGIGMTGCAPSNSTATSQTKTAITESAKPGYWRPHKLEKYLKKDIKVRTYEENTLKKNLTESNIAINKNLTEMINKDSTKIKEDKKELAIAQKIINHAEQKYNFGMSMVLIAGGVIGLLFGVSIGTGLAIEDDKSQ